MVNKLVNSRLGAVFTTDPAVALWTVIKNNWTQVTGYDTLVPAQATVKFDTKFGELAGFNYYVIVENMPNLVKPQTLGGSRYQYEDVKRLQIMAVGPSAKDKKWKMERHIDSLINGNPTLAQTTYGIDVLQLSDFTEIPVTSDTNTTNFQPVAVTQARSFATVRMYWEQESQTI